MTKLISWNVNGIRAAIKKGFLDFVEEYNPDVLCLQETKARPEQVELELSSYPFKYWNWAEKKGYSGTAIFSKIEPLDVTDGLDISKHDSEGRVITLEYKDYYLVNVYTPNSKRELTRLPYRYNEWDPDFLDFVCSLEKTKPVIFCGDLNVAHQEIDLANPSTNKTRNNFPGNAGFTNQERERCADIINAGFIDTFRFFNQDREHYTWWSYMRQARKRNIGWRIDYFCTSKILGEKLLSSEILKEIMGSDHCPVMIEINV